MIARKKVVMVATRFHCPFIESVWLLFLFFGSCLEFLVYGFVRNRNARGVGETTVKAMMEMEKVEDPQNPYRKNKKEDAMNV